MDYTIITKAYRIAILIISAMDFLIFLKILPSSLFLILIALAVVCSCALSIYIKKNKSKINFAANNRKTDMIVTIIWLASMFAVISA